MKLQIVGIGSTTANLYASLPKSRFEAGNMELNGEQVAVRVTGTRQSKFKAYSYFELDGSIYYTAGNLIGTECEAEPDQVQAAGTGFDLD